MSGWGKEWPKANGIYWLRGWRHNADLPISIDGERFFMLFDLTFKHKSELDDSDAVEFLGPITPADTEQLVRLREESLKGICVYCGEIQQYESLEQKASEEGNALRVEHIKQCAKRPELKLIDAMVQLHEAATAALKWIDELTHGKPLTEHGNNVITALRNALGTKGSK